MAKRFFVFLILFSVFLTGCAQNPYGNAYSTSGTRQVQNVYYGTIVSTQAVTIDPNQTGVGTLAGGAIGGLLGSKVGKGTGSTIAAIGGAILGGVLGSATQGGITRRNGVNLTIKLDNGRVISIVQQVNPKVIFRTGQRVQVNIGGSGSRVAPIN
jgi:outer membrane lipoprotein SlyB